MSFEGRYQKLCKFGHYTEQDVYMETDKCECGEPWVKSNMVDDTNGDADGYDESMAGGSYYINGQVMYPRSYVEFKEKEYLALEQMYVKAREKQNELEQRLAKAEQVIRFYGVADWNIAIRQPCGRLDMNDLYLDCGKRAREYQAKYLSDK